jgi:hypothetical protein
MFFDTLLLAAGRFIKFSSADRRRPHMKKKANRLEQQDGQGSPPSSTESKKRWQEPKLSFVKPKLTKHGKLEQVTGQFFGAFSPGREPG